MKKNFLLVLLVLSITAFSQTKDQKQKIIQNYNLNKLQNLADQFSNEFDINHAKAIEWAKINNKPIKYTKNGVFYELQKLTSDGNPIYYKTHNSDAARSTRANTLHNGGILGLNIEGQGMTAYVWDGGIARATHQEYDGIGGNDRFSEGGDGGTLNDHSAHVMGTIIASGVQPNAKGMAPQAFGIGYDWNSDEAEVTDAAADGMLISNHSYGPDITNAAYPDWQIGAYTFESRVWDLILYNAPYYVSCISAGNDGNINNANGDPLDGNQYFDKLSGDKSTSKNSIVVANANDASIDSNGNLISVSINSSSSEGPTDDYRIKPDITGNGTWLYSTISGSNTSYASYTGTSMSSPNVAGSLLLLQQYYNEVNGSFMRASTLKGLALHTADDAGLVGPDAVWGWGLMNTKAAAEAITHNGLGSLIIEDTLDDGETITLTVISDNINPLLASISWTDLPATNYNSGTANDTTPVLVNDLDIRVSSNGTDYEPWKLTGVNTNSQGDNIVDPFERVDVDSASGTYTITISHKGTLTNGSQDFALIITGLGSEFTFQPTNDYIEQCASSNAEFDFNFVTANGTVPSTSLSAQNVPSGASVSFSPSSLTTDGTFTMTISDLLNVTPGEYIIDVVAQNANESETHQVYLEVYNPNISEPTAVYPSNNAQDIPYSFYLEWSEDFNAQSYEIQVAEDTGFSNIVMQDVVEEPTYSVFNLNDNQTYYWRVRPSNICGDGSYSSTYQFTTTDACVSYTYTGSPIDIPDAGSNVTTTFNVTESFNIEDVNVFVDISHDKVATLLIQLISPSGTSIYLQTPDNECEAQNLMVNYDDASQDYVSCNENTSIGYFGVVHPAGSLLDFNGESVTGTWTLDVRDLEPGITGTINSWTLNVCNENVVGIEEEIQDNNFNIWPNPSNGKINLAFESESNEVEIILSDLSGRIIASKSYQKDSNSFNKSIDFGSLKNGIYILNVRSGNTQTSQKIIIK